MTNPRGNLTTTTRTDASDLIAEIVWSRAFDREHSAVGKARYVANAIMGALRREGLLTGTKVASSGEVLEAVKARAERHGKAPTRGISHLVAEALVLLDLPVVHRDVIQSLLPNIDTGAVKNTVYMQFKGALRKFNGWKWINRGDDGLIAILDRDALVQWYTIADDLDDYRASTALDLAKAIQQLRLRMDDGNADELRRLELLAMQRVMQSAPGAATNGRGKVRVVPRSNPL